MLNKNEFTQVITEMVQERMGNGYTLKVLKVNKLNEGTLDTITIMGDENKISPDFYINQFYNDYTTLQLF